MYHGHRSRVHPSNDEIATARKLYRSVRGPLGPRGCALASLVVLLMGIPLLPTATDVGGAVRSPSGHLGDPTSAALIVKGPASLLDGRAASTASTLTSLPSSSPSGSSSSVPRSGPSASTPPASSGSPLTASGGSVASATPSPTSSAGTELLQGAQRSLEQGQGPARGTAWNCGQPAGGGSESCAASSGSSADVLSAPSNPSWALLGTPSPRLGATMAFDQADNEVVLFGGENSAAQGDTWTFRAGSWSPVVTPVEPTPRGYASMAYDVADGYVLLFGGVAPGAGYLQDTWTFSAGSWTKLASATSPGVRIAASMSYDAADGYLVLFGGKGCSTASSCAATDLQDTWKFVGGVWAELFPASSPGIREFSMVGYDAYDGYVLLFGGYGCTTGSSCSEGLLQDTWSYKAGTWSLVTGSTPPGTREAAALAYDPTMSGLILVGGDGCSTGNACASYYLQDTWLYLKGAWSQLTPNAVPGIRDLMPMAYDGVDGYLLLFGGLGCSDASSPCPISYLQDSWVFAAGTWTELTSPSSSPGVRGIATLAYDPIDGYVLLFGGYGCVVGSTCTAGDLGDTWTFQAGTWTELFPNPSPGARDGSALVYDAADGYMLLFGGYGCNTGSTCTLADQQDTWTWAGGSWTQLAPPAPPGARVAPAMSYDPTDGYVLLFGGYGCTTGNTGCTSFLSDTWDFRGGTWTQLARIGPPQRYIASIADDAADGYVVLFGGLGCENYPTCSAYGELADTWRYAGSGNWVNMTSTAGGPPPARDGAGMAFDTADNYLLLFGGFSTTGSDLSDSWKFLGGSWTALSPTLAPGVRRYTEMAYDGHDGFLLLLGGNGCTFGTSCAVNWMQDSWAYGAPLTSAMVVASSASRDVGQSVTFTAGATGGGSGSYQFLWAGLPPGCVPTSPAPGVTCAPTTAGTFQVSTVAEDSTGAPQATSGTLAFMVYSDPTAAASGSTPSIDLGQSATFTLSTSGGSGGDGYAWNGLPTGCSSSAGLSDTCTPALASAEGAWSVSATVTDSNGYSVSSGGVALTVDSDPSVAAPSESRTALDVGQVLSLSTTVSGGSGGYAFTWSGLPTGCSSVNAPSLSCSPSAAGAFSSISVSALDSNGVMGGSPIAASITVSASLVVPTPTSSPGTLDLGQSTTLALSPSGGRAPYTISWFGVPTGCTASGTSFLCTPTATGTYSVYATDADSNGATVTSGAVTVNVLADPQIVSLASNRSATDLGTGFTITVQAIDGTGSYSYTWTGLPLGCVVPGLSTITCKPTVVGPFTLRVYVNDSTGTSTSQTLALMVDSDPTTTAPTASPTSPIDAGSKVVFQTTASGGSGGYSYTWVGLPSASCPVAIGSSLECDTLGVGNYSASALVRDSNGVGYASGALAFTVLRDPVLSNVVANRTAIDVGARVIFNATAYRGQGPYSYDWSGLPAGCSSANTAMLSCLATGSGSFSVGVSVADAVGGSASSTTLGYVVYPDPSLSSPSASATTLDLGQSVAFSTTLSGGSGGFSFTWSGLPGTCSGTGGSSPSCTTTAAGNFSIMVSGKDSAGAWTSSTSLAVRVLKDPGVTTPTAVPSAVDMGESTTFFGYGWGGEAPYTYSWSGLPAGCTSSSAASLSCTPTSAGGYTVQVTVTDALVVSATSPTLTFTVSVALVVSPVTLSPGSIDDGQSTTFSTSASGGVAPYVYAWAGLPSGCLSANTASILCTPSPSTSGTFSIVASVRDAHGMNVSSSLASLTVLAAVAVGALTATRGSLDVGQATTLSATAAGGTGVYSYTWSGLPTGCGSVNSATLTCTPTGSGTFASVGVRATDTNGQGSSSSPLSLVVAPDPTISIPTATLSALDVGQTTTLTVSTTSGSGGPVYAWVGLPVGCPSANALSVACTPASGGTGTFTVKASVVDSNGDNISSGPLTLYVYPALGGASLTATRGSLDVGESTTLTASSTGGSGGLIYAWSGLPSGCPGGNVPTVACVPTSPGSVSVSVAITDSSGASVSAGVTLTVYADPTVTTPVATRVSLDLGQSTTLSSVSTPGSGSPVYAWLGLPSGCLSASVLTLSCTPASAGTFLVTVSVQDSDGMNVSSGGLTLTVAPALGTPGLSASRSAVDVGESTSLLASASGGSGGYSYTWTGLPSGCVSINNPTLGCTPSAAGTFTAVLDVSDSNGASSSASIAIAVSPALTAAVPTSSLGGVDTNQSATLAAHAGGGLAPLVLSWWGLPTGCLSSNAVNLVCVPRSSGTYLVSYTVADANGQNVSSASLTLVVTPAPSTPLLAASLTALDLGQAAVITAAVSGGALPLSYGWTGLPTGCASVDSSSLTCSPTATGTFSVGLAVADANGATSAAVPITVTAFAAPTVGAPSASRVSLDDGEGTNLSVAASSGGGPLSLTWWGLPSGCASSNATAISCVPASLGTFTVWVEAVDARGVLVQGPPLVLTVDAALGSAAITASSSAFDLGAPLTLGASVSGGSGSFAYDWTGLPPGCVAASSATLTCTPSRVGSFTVQVGVADGNGARTSASQALRVYAALEVNLTATPLSASEGTTLTFSSSVSGGTGTISYAWFLNGTLQPGATGRNFTVPNAHPGTYQVALKVADGSGSQVLSTTVSVAVSSTSPPPTPSPAPASPSLLGGHEPDAIVVLLFILIAITLTMAIIMMGGRKRRRVSAILPPMASETTAPEPGSAAAAPEPTVTPLPPTPQVIVVTGGPAPVPGAQAPPLPPPAPEPPAPPTYAPPSPPSPPLPRGAEEYSEDKE
ncbi:MAG: hypothetical protein KGI98_06205 [Euryarchaeota archaeon]|nr:hypothetical protein [Euryarchaeota archaeon]